MPTSVVQPKYKVVYSYPVDMGECWDGPQFQEGDMVFEKKKVPIELTVTVNVPHIDSMKSAKLDIEESNLVFEYPNLYYLDVNLKYKVNKDKGSAKFDKSKKSLVVRLPVVGLTEDSQKVLEKNYEEFQELQKKKKE